MKKKKLTAAAVFLLLLLVQLAVLFYYGERKSGFHEDEFYSYYSTNKTAGLFVNDREWIGREDFRNDFVVLPGERFRYDVVKQMQSWDVHPPFYYYILHTACSLFPGVFSKWLGIGINVLAYIPCFFLLASIVLLCVEKDPVWGEETGRRRAVFLAFLVCAFWGFSAAVISGVMFIRMYQYLTLFILLCVYLHVKAMRRQDFGARFLLPLIPTVFLGFMTQYYYIIFHFFLGLGMCFLFLRKKKWKELMLYAVSCGAGLGAAILYYSASMSHIFRGYRGTEAVSEFGDAGNTLGRLRFFAGLFNDYVLNGALAFWLLAICLLWITAVYVGKRRQGVPGCGPAAGLLLFACAGYFFTVSKTALLLGETSNRYQLPIYGPLIFLLLYFFCRPVWFLADRSGGGEQGGGLLSEKTAGICALALLAFLLLGDILAMTGGKVFFLYEEERPVMEYVKENSDVPVVVFYNEASPDNVWRLSDELMEFPEVYLASQGNPEEITEKRICQSGRLLVYVADHENKEDCLENLLLCNEALGSYRVAAEKGLWTLYEMGGF